MDYWNGLKIAEEFYNEYGKQMIDEKFPEYKDKIAVGLAGQGSECFGYDDAVSRDHDYAPGFCLWIILYALWEFLGRPIAADFLTHGVEVLGILMLIFILPAYSLSVSSHSSLR